MTKFVIIFFTILSVVQCYKILLVFPIPSRSHFILGNALARGLADAGHEVTVVSPFGDKNPPKNYRDVILTGFLERKKEQNIFNAFDMEKTHPILSILILNVIGHQIVNATFDHPNIQQLLAANEHYDVIIMEQFKNKAMNIFQWYYKAPLILFSTVGPTVWVNSLTANPTPFSYVPNMFLSYSSRMTIWQRMFNSITTIFEYLNEYILFEFFDKPLLQQFFPKCSDIDAAINNVSLVLLNSHESSNQPVPLVPSMVNIGGFHIKPSKELPKDLQEFMDKAKDGVIYFSLGSNIDPSEMKEETKQAILKALGKLKQQVLWKYDQKDIPGKPSNVKLDKWFPQQDILAHPNTKLFITHGGLLSTLETLYHGVPVLTLPVFGDQKMNAAKAKEIGYGLTIPFSEITEERLTDCLNQLLNDPKYRETAKQRSIFLHDRPTKPLDLAVYWTEFIAKHKGAPHLKVSGADLPWYQYLLLDVIGLLGLIICTVVLIFYLTCKKLCCSKKSSNKLKAD